MKWVWVSPHGPLVPLPLCPQHHRDTSKNGFHHVFTSPTQLQSHRLSLWGWAGAGTESWIPSWGWGGTALGLHSGELSHPLSPKEARGECFHFRVLESSWALWHLEKLPPPISCPIRMGWGEDLALAVGEVMAPQAPGHSQKGGVSPGQTPIWDQVLKRRGEGQGGQGSSVECSLDEVVGWTILAGTRRQAQPDRGKAQVAITQRSCTAAGV